MAALYELMQAVALTVIIVSALWLVAIGFYMVLRPHHCLNVLARTAATRRINNTEQGLRLLAGIALVVRVPSATLPQAFEIGGWFVVVSSLALLMIPLRWHADYAIWWSKALPLWAVRLIGPFSTAGGIALITAAI